MEPECDKIILSIQALSTAERSLTMSAKRKDKKGRVLRTGESQRKDLTYQYRYTDSGGKRHTVYAPTLDGLREKEKEINSTENAGASYNDGGITVIELLERYISLKQGVRYATTVGYGFVLSLVKKEAFGQRRIRDIKPSDAKLWFMKLQKDGRGYSTITSVRGVVKPAFQMAYEEEILRRNPFDFKLSDVVKNDSKKRIALTQEQRDTFMGFIKGDKHFSRYYDEFTVLLETGMRVSEMCGLTREQLDFANRRIWVDHQLVRMSDGTLFAEKTKTESGCRFLPMTDNVRDALQRIIANRKSPDIEYCVDGYSGFLLLDKNGKPCVAMHIEHHMQWAMKKYRKLHPDDPLPTITPHVLRHTFCTNMANAGMAIKDLQYLMGHSDADVTLNVYTHASYAHAESAMRKILQFQTNGNAQKFG